MWDKRKDLLHNMRVGWFDYLSKTNKEPTHCLLSPEQCAEYEEATAPQAHYQTAVAPNFAYFRNCIVTPMTVYRGPVFIRVECQKECCNEA